MPGTNLSLKLSAILCLKLIWCSAECIKNNLNALALVILIIQNLASTIKKNKLKCVIIVQGDKNHNLVFHI